MSSKYNRNQRERQMKSRVSVGQPNENVCSRSVNVYIRFEATLSRYIVQVVQVPTKRVAFVGYFLRCLVFSLSLSASASARSCLLSVSEHDGLDLRRIVALEYGNGRWHVASSHWSIQRLFSSSKSADFSEVGVTAAEFSRKSEDLAGSFKWFSLYSSDIAIKFRF